MKLFRFLFSFKGRISRLPFWLFSIVMTIITLPAFIYFSVGAEEAHTAADAGVVFITPRKPPGTEGAHTLTGADSVYTWTDASGTTHFSDIPRHHGSEKTLVLPTPPAPSIWKTSPPYYVAIIFFVVLWWSSLAVQAKRWHDRDKSGWWILINFVPLIGPIWALVENYFLSGTEGPNRFGVDPLGWNQ